MFYRMLEEGVVFDRVIYMIVFSVCVWFGGLVWGKEIYVCVVKDGFVLDVRFGNVFINMYFKVGSMKDVC